MTTTFATTPSFRHPSGRENPTSPSRRIASHENESRICPADGLELIGCFELDEGAEIPSAAAASQAVNVVLHNAKRSTINVTTAQSAGEGAATTHGPASAMAAETTSRIPAWIRGPWALLLGVSTIAGGAAVLATWQGWGPF